MGKVRQTTPEIQAILDDASVIKGNVAANASAITSLLGTSNSYDPRIGQNETDVADLQTRSNINVASLPASGQLTNVIYHLTATDSNAPVGFYIYGTNGWICIAQTEKIALTWSGAVSEELFPGVAYQVSVSAAITSLSLTLSDDGVCRILLDNPTLYAIALPTVGYMMTSMGLDELAEASVRIGLQRDTVVTTAIYEWSTTKRVAL